MRRPRAVSISIDLVGICTISIGPPATSSSRTAPVDDRTGFIV